MTPCKSCKTKTACKKAGKCKKKAGAKRGKKTSTKKGY